MKRTIAIAFALGVSACGTTPEPVIQIETREVVVPVAVSCVPDSLPAAPVYSVSEAEIRNAPNPETRALLVTRYALERSSRVALLEPVVAGCR